MNITTIATSADVDPIIAQMIAQGLMAAPETAIELGDDLASLDDTLIDTTLSGMIVGPELVEIEGLSEHLEEIAEEIEAQSEIEALDSLEETLAAQAAREEVYAEQDSKIGMIVPIVAATAAAPTIHTPASTPRAPRAAGVVAPKREARFGAGAVGSYVASVATDAALTALVEALPKKVKEKAANLVDFIYKGRTLSVFTKTAVDILNTEGKISNERLVKAFTTEASKRGMGGGYSIGTARSQAGQQVALFGRLDIATNTGGVLVPNAGNAIWQRLAV